MAMNLKEIEQHIKDALPDAKIELITNGDVLNLKRLKDGNITEK